MKAKFKDFSFKLAVIQVLMYEKKLLKPEFHLKNSNPKQDNKMIPRVKKYFKDMEIPAELLLQVTEIEQDPNNDVILELIPIWDGEGNEFVIKSAEDVKLVPNLKKATIFKGYAEKEIDDEYRIFEDFASRGVDVSAWGISKKGTPDIYKKIEQFKKQGMGKLNSK